MPIKLEPLGARLLVRLRPLKAVSTLIVMPMQRQTCREADVIAVGPEVRDCSVGDVVYVNSLAGQSVGDEIILPESAVLGYAESGILSDFGTIEGNEPATGIAHVYEDNWPR